MKKNSKAHIKHINNKKIRQLKLISVLAVLLCVVIAGLLAGSGSADKETEGDASEASSEEVIELNIESAKNDSGNQAFNISLEDFIASFNSHYAKDTNAEYLGSIDQWQIIPESPTVYASKDTSCYIFSQEPDIRSVPQLKVYADSTKTGIYQISLAYDDHSYSPETYDMYRELCMYTFMVMCPEMTKDELSTLIDDILSSVDESFTYEKPTDGAAAGSIYKDKNVEVFSYNVAGDTMEVRIAPAR